MKMVTKFNCILALMVTQATCIFAGEEFTLDRAQAAAEKGDPKAEYFLAKRYASGDGVKQDYAKAAQLLRQAAEQGHVFAENDLGAYYAKGLGVKQDFAEAAKWYRRAAENGDALAQFSMGRIYSLGRGVPEDQLEAVKWFKKAAGQNQPNALEMLGDIYLNGRTGIAIDFKEAFKYLDAAVHQGRTGCLNSLGFLHEHGQGVEKNLEHATECYREAAEKNDARGQMNLGRMYEEGLGVKKDLIEAYKWFSLAQRNGEGIATHYLDELEDGNMLSHGEIDEARHRADVFSDAFEAKMGSRSRQEKTDT